MGGWRTLLAFIGLLAFIASSAKAEVKVAAKISPNPAVVNQITNLTITIENGDLQTVPEPNLPPPVGVAGGPSRTLQSTFVNGVQTSVVSIIWPISSPKEGVFTIPPIKVRASGQEYTTRELRVEFTAAPVTTKPDGPSRENGRGAQDPVLQLQVGKTEFYQGEIVPVTATLYVPYNIGLARIGLIEVEKSDFAVQRFPQAANQGLETLGRVSYRTYAFQSTVSALKAGKANLGPAKMELHVEVPMGNSGGFPFPFQQMQRKKIIVEAPEIPMTVLSLPAEGKPPGFSGAVGDFTLKASTNTHDVTVGDPVSLDLVIEGQGNFDALESPKLTQQEGWKSYPARRYNIDSTDPNNADLMNRGVGFSQILVPEKVMPAIPPFEFSFFNPRSKTYSTLRSNAIPLTIKPSDKAAAPVMTEAPVTSTKPDANPAPVADISDIIARIPASPHWAVASVPLMEQHSFRFINVLLFLALLGLVCAHLYKRWKASRASSVDEDRRTLLSDVERSGLSEAEFYRRAAQFLHRYAGANIPDAAKGLLQKYETLNFAGPGAGAGPVDPAARAEALAILKQLKPAAPPSPSRPVVASVVLALMASGSAHAAETTPADSRYQAVAQALEKQDFKGAQKLGEALVNEGQISPELFTLIGHAVYKQKDPGGAAIWYQRAQLFPQAIPEVRQNLRHIQEKFHFFSFDNHGPLDLVALFASRNQWMGMTAIGGWMIVFAFAFLVLRGGARVHLRWVAGAALGVLLIWLSGGFSGEGLDHLLSQSAHPWWTGGAWVMGQVLAIVGIVGLVIHLLACSPQWVTLSLVLGLGGILILEGVASSKLRPSMAELEKRSFVTAPSALAHTAAAEISGHVISVPAGSTVRRVDERGGWTYVEIPQPEENVYGWLLTKDLTPVWPFDPNKLP